MSKRWKPGLNEVFWYINSGNKIDYTTNNGFGCDEEKIAAGNCFFTQAEALAAAEKVKALLLSLHDEPATECSQSVTECNQLPKLTTEVFDRPDCPKWAQWAAVDYYGNAFFFEGKPFMDAGRWYKKRGDCDPVCFGTFDRTNWFDSLIEHPNINPEAPETKCVLPDWCKVGDWVYLSNGTYHKIEKIDGYGIILDCGIVIKTDYIHEEAVSARLRPYNAEEMKALVGKVITHPLTGDVSFVTGFCNGTEKIYSGTNCFNAETLLKDFTINNTPCGVLEHLENGEWVE